MADLIRIELDDTRVNQALTELRKRTDDTSPAFRKIRGVLRDATDERFNREGMPPWAPLAESTRVARAKEGTWPGKIMYRSGHLLMSISSSSGKDFATVGTSKKWAIAHQLGVDKTVSIRQHSRIINQAFGHAISPREITVGSHNRRMMIPARPIFGLTDENVVEIVDIITDFILGR